MSYPDSVRYLYSLGNELQVGVKFGLERMQTLLAGLGHPERGQRFVHVAGTNGKGSTSAAIASVLQEGGLVTGLYTSPHLQEPTERIQINRVPVSTGDFAVAFEQVHRVAEQLVADSLMDAHPSYFETITAMALLLFQQRCEISVIEVGLGGRLDATNVILPELTVITPVSFDHEAYLGNTLELIASEKAGILKIGVPAIFARQSPAARSVLETRAATLGVTVVDAAEALVSNLRISADRSSFDLDGNPFEFSLAGRHQVENAVTAILAGRTLGVPEVSIERGLSKVHWPGRLERVGEHPDLILDGAHNPAGAAALADYIREVYADRPVWIVYGAMRDKAIEEVTSQLFPLARRLILTAPQVPRALRPEVIAEMTDHPHTTLTESIEQAAAIARSAPPETAIFFTGSLFVVGEARRALLGSQ